MGSGSQELLNGPKQCSRTYEILAQYHSSVEFPMTWDRDGGKSFDVDTDSTLAMHLKSHYAFNSDCVEHCNSVICTDILASCTYISY